MALSAWHGEQEKKRDWTLPKENMAIEIVSDDWWDSPWLMMAREIGKSWCRKVDLFDLADRRLGWRQ
jgi:hypothetical protein